MFLWRGGGELKRWGSNPGTPSNSSIDKCTNRKSNFICCTFTENAKLLCNEKEKQMQDWGSSYIENARFHSKKVKIVLPS